MGGVVPSSPQRVSDTERPVRRSGHPAARNWGRTRAGAHPRTLFRGRNEALTLPLTVAELEGKISLEGLRAALERADQALRVELAEPGPDAYLAPRGVALGAADAWQCLRCGAWFLTRDLAPLCPHCGFREDGR
jgi:hypothetical protein